MPSWNTCFCGAPAFPLNKFGDRRRFNTAHAELSVLVNMFVLVLTAAHEALSGDA